MLDNRRHGHFPAVLACCSVDARQLMKCAGFAVVATVSRSEDEDEADMALTGERRAGTVHSSVNHRLSTLSAR